MGAGPPWVLGLLRVSPSAPTPAKDYPLLLWWTRNNLLVSLSNVWTLLGVGCWTSHGLGCWAVGRWLAWDVGRHLAWDVER